MSSNSNSVKMQLREFLAARIDPADIVLIAAEVDERTLGKALADFVDDCDIHAQQLIRTLTYQALDSTKLIAVPVTTGVSLVIARVVCEHASDMLLFSKIEGSPQLASNIVRNAVEAWCMWEELSSSRAALEDSAMQLAQSYEEQNWLRCFARNASSLSRSNSANDMAKDILQPLGYLLRAQDTYLLVDSEETTRSGLVDTKFGTSDFSIDCIRKLLKQFGLGQAGIPLVRNRVKIETDHGVIHSLIAVAIGGSEHFLGHLVGINRSADVRTEGLPVYDPEFGSGEVGLLEEAAVLLSTQAHNIHLLIQSNQLFLGTLHAMSCAIDARDAYTQGHSERVARLSFDLAKILGLSHEASQEIYLAGVLHDIGKIGIPDSVLLKNGPLTEEELRIVQQHPEIGFRIVERLGHLSFVLPGVLYHHERWDGRGYPHSLRGESIPLMARIMAVADAFDAMTSSRPYRNAMPIEKAERIINSGKGEQWDAQIVDCFNIWLDNRLNDPTIAIVPNHSIIPQESPVEKIAQAVMTLGR